MKKFLIPGIVLMLVFVFSNPLMACHYKFESKVKQTTVGEIIEVKVQVIYEHRRCVIELDDTRFNLKNFELIKQSSWSKEKRGTYSIVLILKSTKIGDAKLEVIRECSKKGISAAEWKVAVLDTMVAVNEEIKKSRE
ncbi:hypothetical protein KAR48_02135 [bacterium]|nr:hypothetical protein [bacterium]